VRNPPLILAVDDTEENLEILRVRLAANGYKIVSATDGEKGLVRARELTPDLILLDFMMPNREASVSCGS
jgi:adenylate cyclase